MTRQELERRIKDIERRCCCADEVVFYDELADFPAEGNTGKIYVDETTDLLYRWDGSAYVLVGGSGGGSVEWGDITGVLADQTDLQTALDLKANLASPTFTGTVVLPSTTSIGTVSSTEIGYVDGVTSGIQAQIDLKAPLASPTFTGTVVLPSTTSIGTITNTELSYIDGLTSSAQNQIDAKVSSQWITSGSNIYFTAGNVGVGSAEMVSTIKLRVSAPFTNTDTTERYLMWLSSNEPFINNPFGLNISVKGAATLADRSILLDTSDYGSAYGGNIILQQVTGNVGIGVTSPTAIVHLKAGTSTAGTAPLKFTAGTHLGTPENGAMEFDGTHLYITIGGVRVQLDN